MAWLDSGASRPGQSLLLACSSKATFFRHMDNETLRCVCILP